jgi:hypothetical protein
VEEKRSGKGEEMRGEGNRRRGGEDERRRGEVHGANRARPVTAPNFGI